MEFTAITQSRLLRNRAVVLEKTDGREEGMARIRACKRKIFLNSLRSLRKIKLIVEPRFQISARIPP
jgi:hypothetical protein